MTELLTLTHDFLRLADLNLAPEAPRLVELATALHEWNQRLNLTAANSPRAILTDHLFDSLTLAPLFNKHGGAAGDRWADIGSGGGFPALPLAIALPAVEFTLIESIGKKCRVLEALIARLKLANCRVICARAETMGRAADWRGAFAFATARALGPFSVQVELGLPLLAVGGHLLLQKSAKGQTEIEQAQGVATQLGGEVTDVKRLQVSGFLSPRLIAVVRKTGETPARYPRRPGIPARRPLR